MHLPHWVQKIIMSALVIALLLPGVYVALTPQAPAEAQWLNLGTMIDFTAIANFIQNIGGEIAKVAKIAIDIALYKTVKYAVRQLGDQGAQWVGRAVSNGRVGQEPLFWEQTPQEMLEQSGEAAGGFFIEGMAEGMAMEEEAKSGVPKDRAGKASRGAVLQRAQQIVNQMCNPDPRFRFDLLAGIAGNLSMSFGLPIPPFGLPPILGAFNKKTEKPACTFTQAYKNWKKVVTDTATQFNDQLKGAWDTITNFPKMITEAFEQDKRDVTDAIDRIGKMNTNLNQDKDYMAKAQALSDSIAKKLGLPADLTTTDIGTLQKGLSEFQTNLKNLPTDPEIKGNFDAVRAKVKEKAPDGPIQAKLDAIGTFLGNDVYENHESADKTALKKVFDTILVGGGIDNPFIMDRLREIQGIAAKDARLMSSAEFGVPLKELLDDQNLTSRAYFNRAEQVVKNVSNNPKVQQLIGNAQGAAGVQAAADQENAQRRVTGNLTGWQVLQDMTDPSKASDLTVQSKTQSTLNDFLAKMREDAVLKRTENNGIRPVTTLSGQVTSPPLSVAALVSGSIAGQVNQEGKFTGNAVVDAADLIGEFADSIFSKSGQLIMEGFTKTNPDQPVAQQNKIEEMIKALGTPGEPVQPGTPGTYSISGVLGGETNPIGKSCPIAGCPSPLACEPKSKTCQIVGTDEECSDAKPCKDPLFCDKQTNTCQPPATIVNNPQKCPDTPCPESLVCNQITGRCEVPDSIIGATTDLSGNNIRPPGHGSSNPPDERGTPSNTGISNGNPYEPDDNPNRYEPDDNPNRNVSVLPSSELITNPAASPDIVRRASIEARISKLVALPPSKEEQLNILGTLSSECTPGTPDSCTIRPAFAQSIQQQLTVAESVARFKQTGGSSGLDENAIFGYKRGLAGQAIEPDLSQGIPYSSMVILRKYRIVPIAWEITALYIRDHPGICGTRDCTLGDVLRNYSNSSSKFYKLMDPNWLLKAPGAKCMLQGYGPPIEQVGAEAGSMNENAQWICRGDPNLDRGVISGTNPPQAKQCQVEYKIQPRAQICLDQQTCLDQDSKGRCKGYGYCLEEKKRWQFTGTECKKQFSSCLSFANTTTGVTTSFLRDSLAAFGYGGICNESNAGCGWYSKALAKKDATSDGSQRSQYDWDGSKKAFFTNTAKNYSCTAEAEGCSKLVRQNDNADTYIKVAPAAYGCDQNLTGSYSTQPIGYKKEICKGFALHCPSAYAGCASYTPTNGDPPVTGIAPIACNAACIGLARFSQVATQLETPTRISYDFIPSTTLRCTAEQAGCDEYTNLEGGAAGGGEQRDYYSTITRCVKKLDNAEDQRAAHQDVFYSWTGSESGGAQLEKFLLVSTSDTAKSPVCWKNSAGVSSCDCNSAFNAPGRPLCRQFFRLNPDGSPSTTQSWWRIQNDLVYVTDTADCAQYRRTLDTAAPDTRYYISKSMSKTCPATAAGCREYHATQAGNLTALPPDTFNENAAGTWIAGPADDAALALTATKEGETLGDSSLKVVSSDASKAALSIQKPVALRSGSVMIGFAIKGPSGALVDVQLYSSTQDNAILLASETNIAQTAGSSASTNELNGAWQYFQYAVSNLSIPSGVFPALRITLSKNTAASFTQFYLDDVTVRQSDGFLFAIKDSWKGRAPAQCYVNKPGSVIEKDWNTGVPDQLSCQNYTDTAGNQMTFQRFTALCPKEMVNCMSFSDGSADVSLVDDPKKYCRQQDDRCTAYGLPQYNTKREVIGYTNRYYKILPIDSLKPDYSKGICTEAETECKDYATKYSHAYFKQPGTDIARWRVAADEEKENHPNGVWYTMTCGEKVCGNTMTKCASDNECPSGVKCAASDASSDTTKCLSDTQCSGDKKCIHQVQIADTDMSLARLCPSNQSTCSKVVDPECRMPDPDIQSYLTLRTNYGRTQGTSDTGIACQREYYYLDDVYANTGQCTGRVDVEKGCLLFQADYPFDGQGKKVSEKYDTDFIYRNGKDDVTATGQVRKDANSLVKVKLDRSCKVWLGCTDEQVDATGHRTCTERRPCLELDENGECANFADTESKQNIPELKYSFDAASDTRFASLAGLSRPEVKVAGGPPANDPRSILHDGFFDWSGNESMIGAVAGDVNGVSGFSKALPASCRSHPQKDAPSQQRPGDIDQCDYSRDGNSYKGLKGFCLEKYAKKGYENYCLNWYPTDKPAGALPAFDSSASGEGRKAYMSSIAPVNYCIARDTMVLYDQPSWDHARMVDGYCSSNDGTMCSPATPCPPGKGTCSLNMLSQSGSITPSSKTLSFSMIVKRDGSNNCSYPVWGIASNTSYYCSQWTGRSCTTLGSTSECADTNTNYCTLSGRGCTQSPHSLCYTTASPSSECQYDVTENGTCTYYTNSSHPCPSGTTCLPYAGSSVCIAKNFCHSPHRSCWGAGNDCVNGSPCTNPSVTLSGNCVEAYWDCNGRPSGTSITTNNCNGSWSGATPPSKGTCTVNGGTCIAHPNSIKMSCSEMLNFATTAATTNSNDASGFVHLTSGDLSAQTISIKKADGTPLNYSVPLTKSTINSIDYSVALNGTDIANIIPAIEPAWPTGYNNGHTAWSYTIGIKSDRTSVWDNAGQSIMYPPNRTCNLGERWFFITPQFTGPDGTLSGFKYVLCADASSADQNYTVSATVTFKPQNYASIRIMKQLKLTEDYCTEFAQTVDASGHAIPANPVRDSLWTPDAITDTINTSSNPYSFGGRKEIISQREYRVVTVGVGAISVTPALATSQYNTTDPPESNPSRTESNALYNIPNHNTISASVLSLSGISGSVRAWFAKIYQFFTLNSSKTRYSAGLTSAGGTTTEGYWNTTVGGITEFPLFSSRRCSQNAPDGNEVMCSDTRICPNGKEDCTRRVNDTFILTFPRESSSQQIATMQFYAWTQSSKTPLRRLDILWGDTVKNIYNTVGSGTNDNQDGFAGKVCESGSTVPCDKEFTFLHTYPTTFWRNPTRALGTNICVFTQDNWYFWKKICGRFKKGESGFIELDKSYNADSFINGWKSTMGKGIYNGTQAGP